MAHNLIHDTADPQSQRAGDCPGQPPFTRNNTIEFNHIYNTMQVTADGAGMYVTYGHGGRLSSAGNPIDDTHCNPFRRGESELQKSDIPCHGLYLEKDRLTVGATKTMSSSETPAGRCFSTPTRTRMPGKTISS